MTMMKIMAVFACIVATCIQNQPKDGKNNYVWMSWMGSYSCAGVDEDDEDTYVCAHCVSDYLLFSFAPYVG